MAKAQETANRAVRDLGDLVSAKKHEHVELGGGNSTPGARLEHYQDFLKALNLDAVIAELRAKVGSFDMKNVPHQRTEKLKVRQLTDLTKALRSKDGLSAASPNGIPKCLRALYNAKENGHNIDAAVEQIKKEIDRKSVV